MELSLTDILMIRVQCQKIFRHHAIAPNEQRSAHASGQRSRLDKESIDQKRCSRLTSGSCQNPPPSLKVTQLTLAAACAYSSAEYLWVGIMVGMYNEQELQPYLEMGLFISVAGTVCMQKRGAHLRERLGKGQFHNIISYQGQNS